jgi:hypothetical protein
MFYHQVPIRFITLLYTPPFFRNYSLSQNVVALALVGLGAVIQTPGCFLSQFQLRDKNAKAVVGNPLESRFGNDLTR